jgi:hypothetical protein
VTVSTLLPTRSHRASEIPIRKPIAWFVFLFIQYLFLAFWPLIFTLFLRNDLCQQVFARFVNGSVWGQPYDQIRRKCIFPRRMKVRPEGYDIVKFSRTIYRTNARPAEVSRKNLWRDGGRRGAARER